MRHRGLQGPVQNQIQFEEAHEAAQSQEAVQVPRLQQRLLLAVILNRAFVYAYEGEALYLWD